MLSSFYLFLLLSYCVVILLLPPCCCFLAVRVRLSSCITSASCALSAFLSSSLLLFSFYLVTLSPSYLSPLPPPSYLIGDYCPQCAPLLRPFLFFKTNLHIINHFSLCIPLFLSSLTSLPLLSAYYPPNSHPQTYLQHIYTT